jgi:Flp pilus assembly protein TadD
MGEMELTIPQALEMGSGMAAQGNHAGAIGMFKGILEHEPENWDVINRLGASCFEDGRLYEAFWWFHRAREANPKQPRALTNYALTLSQLGQTEKAIPDLERACALGEKQDLSASERALNYNNLGNALERLGRYQDAEQALRRGIAYDPTDPFPRYNLGIVLMRLNRHIEARSQLEKSLALQEEAAGDTVSRLQDADAHYNLGINYLLHGEFEQGWEHYESRLLTSECGQPHGQPNLGLPAETKWKVGESIEGKRIVVHCEQGVGDAIMFMRFLPLLRRENPAEILLIAHRAIRHLVDIEGVRILQPMEKIFWNGSKEALGLDIKETFDCWVAQMSLPLYLGLDTEEKIAEVPPWTPRIPAAKLTEWAHVRKEGKLNVGLCWAGFWKHKNDAHRSLDLRALKPLFEAPSTNFISVQQVRPQDELAVEEMKTAYPNLAFLDVQDFGDTAAVLLHCDLVISVDTSVAHMAGTLLMPTWIFIPKFSTDWRWQLGDRTDSPWYPTVHLWRQPKIGEWGSVIEAMALSLWVEDKQ